MFEGSNAGVSKRFVLRVQSTPRLSLTFVSSDAHGAISMTVCASPSTTDTLLGAAIGCAQYIDV